MPGAISSPDGGDIHKRHEVMSFRTAWPLVFVLMTGCASLSQAEAPLSQAELRAAKTHADNLCLMSERSGKDFAQTMQGLTPLPVAADFTLTTDQENLSLVAGTEMARQRGCV